MQANCGRILSARSRRNSEVRDRRKPHLAPKVPRSRCTNGVGCVRDTTPGGFGRGADSIGTMGYSGISSAPMRQTRPSFGGVRYWFACPLCSSSSRVLFWKPPSLNPACRRCNGFAYSTQRMAPAARWDHRARRIERRLGGQRDDGVIYKPKHMHWRTYHRLMDAVQEFNDAATLYRMSRDRGMRSVLRGRGLSI
jgi:hypothetical protein